MSVETEGILCSKTHEYIVENEDKTFKIGLTDYAVEQLGDIVFVELPEVGTQFNKNDVFATIESVKAASEIYMPISGTIVEINENVVNSPEIINESPFTDGWLVKISNDSDQIEFVDLVDYKDYKEEL